MNYDDWLEEPYMRQDVTREAIWDEDEGMQLLDHASDYLDPSDDEGDILAIDEIDTCRDLIAAEYECRHCGRFIGERNSYCGPLCYKADQL